MNTELQPIEIEVQPNAPTGRDSVSFKTVILVGLLSTNKNLYAGTVPAHVKKKRRAKNKIAKVSRKINRGA